MRFHIDSKHAPEDCGLVNPTKESLWHQIGLKDAKKFIKEMKSLRNEDLYIVEK